MRKKIYATLFYCAMATSLLAQGIFNRITFQSPISSPLHEVRAVWLTTIGGIDWPHSYAQSAVSIKKQQQEFRDILDRLCQAGINTVMLQTRIRATTIFPSTMEPWDGCLSGRPETSPGYDALAFAISECHKRGMKLHAWIVTIPVGKWNGAGCRNLRKTHPSLIKKIGDEGFMNPESEFTSSYISDFCKDIASRYDIDGIHLDYIRYPDSWGVIKDKKAGRRNITRIVHAVHDKVKVIKPWIQLSCSPVGKYADTRRQWSHGWNARDIVCQEVDKWLQEGMMDAIYPMMYFKNENFYPFAIDWQERSHGKIVAPGLGIYLMHPREKNWPLTDITRELHVLRQAGMGNCIFRSKFFTDNTKGISDYYSDAFATAPSLQPAMSWLSSTKPATPVSISAEQTAEGTVISWTGSKADDITYNLYGSYTYPVNTATAECLLAGNLQQNSINIGPNGSLTYFAVTATDRYGNESAALQSFCNNDADASNATSVSLPVFQYTDGEVIMNEADINSNDLLIIATIMGNDYTSAFVKESNGQKAIAVTNIPSGHYSVYSINKKGFRHLLGQFSVPVK